jgi:hypothetical protein
MAGTLSKIALRVDHELDSVPACSDVGRACTLANTTIHEYSACARMSARWERPFTSGKRRTTPPSKTAQNVEGTAGRSSTTCRVAHHSPVKHVIRERSSEAMAFTRTILNRSNSKIQIWFTRTTSPPLLTFQSDVLRDVMALEGATRAFEQSQQKTRMADELPGYRCRFCGHKLSE